VGASIHTAWTESLDAVRTALDANLADDRAVILRATTQELGPTREAVLDAAMTRLDLSHKQAAEAFGLAEHFEPNPRSFWGYVQGLTRLSQRTHWQDQRFALDRRQPSLTSVRTESSPRESCSAASLPSMRVRALPPSERATSSRMRHRVLRFKRRLGTRVAVEPHGATNAPCGGPARGRRRHGRRVDPEERRGCSMGNYGRGRERHHVS
jgi:hypothetical protein